VHLIAAVDTNGLLSCGGRLPWEFKASGQIKTIADEVANRTVVIGRRAAIAMGGKPPGYNVIVLTLTPAQLRYSRTRKTDVERPVKGLWKGCQVARSVDDVFARCTADSLYVIGGRKTFELFLPFASEVICHVLQTALLDGAPPSPSNLYFPPMLREASLVNVGPDTAVESRFTARREQWRLEPVALPPTRDEATARVAIAKQTSAQPAPAPTAPARPATATPRALWFESTPVGAVMAKKVTLPAPASARAQSTAESALDHKYVGLVPAASANSDDEALREAIQASLLELSIASEMAAMQHHYQVRFDRLLFS
jgi:dihydrofolate reductase